MSEALLWNELGNIYQKLGNLEAAIAAYSQAACLDVESGIFLANLGSAYYQAGDYGRALMAFKKSIPLLDSPSEQAAVWNKMGDAHRSLKDIDHAVEAYRKAETLESDVAPGSNRLSRTTNPLQGVQEINRQRENSLKLKTPGRSILEAVQPDELEEAFELEVEVRDPKAGGYEKNALEKKFQDETPFPAPVGNDIDRPAYLRKPRQQETGFPEKGMTTRLPPGKNRSLYVIPDPSGKEEPSQPEPEPARMEKSPRIQQNQEMDAEENHSTKYSGSRNLEEILAKVSIYENITRVNPANDRAWDTLGKLYKSLGRYQDAISAYLKAIQISPDKEVYYYYLGLLYSVEQLHDNAVKAFTMVLRKNPDYVLAHSALAGVYHRMGLENKTNHHIATALPKMNNESAYNRACFYAICGDNELAFEFLRLALLNKDTTIEWIKSDPDLDPIRTDGRYQKLIDEDDEAAAEAGRNFYSKKLEGEPNRLLPALNQSLSR
jgi:tetratricopeptide (TPR) repeat protein